MLPISDTKTSGKFPLWVVVIIVVNILVFVFELAVENIDVFVGQHALTPSKVYFSNLATLVPFITSQFLHGGFVHIISNMWFLWIFGDNVEERLGFFFFPIVYLFAGIMGGLAQYMIDPSSQIPILGASGAIAGILGAYMALFPHHNIKTLVPFFGFMKTINLPAFVVLLLWFVTQLFNGSATIVVAQSDMGGIAFFAHIGGFAMGWIGAKLFNLLFPKSNW